MNIMKKLGLGSLGVAAATLSTAANAALPDSITTAINNASTDATSAGWLIVGVLAAIFAVKLVARMFGR